MSEQNNSIEIRVGALVLVSLVLLGGFVFILGDFSFSSGKKFHIRFENAGGLKPGADVAIAGLRVGQVESLSFVRTSEGSSDDQSVAVRATVTVQPEHADSIRQSSNFFISTQSVLGEPYVEVVTPSLDSPAVERGAVVTGTSPPRTDLLVSKTSRLLDGFIELFRDPEFSIDAFFKHTASLVKHVDEFFVANREGLDQLVGDAVRVAEFASEILEALRTAIGDGRTVEAAIRDLRATVANSRSIAAKVDEEIAPIADHTAETADNARSITELTDEFLRDNRPTMEKSIANLEASTENVRRLSGNANQLVADIQNGEGTVGQLLNDRRMYDDLREVLRIIKRQPWKIMWKE